MKEKKEKENKKEKKEKIKVLKTCSLPINFKLRAFFFSPAFEQVNSIFFFFCFFLTMYSFSFNETSTIRLALQFYTRGCVIKKNEEKIEK